MTVLAPAVGRENQTEDAASRPSVRLARIDAWLVGIAALFLLALRCLYAVHMKFNSDEPQHLHVVWGWATGRLQYRDVFDNHAPLFHILLSPVLRFVGERPDALIPMRFAMLPLWLGSLAAIHRIFARLYSSRAGLWSALFAAAAPSFFLKMTEFRTDVLWTMFWLIGLAWLVAVPLTKRRIFFAGLALGAALSVSMKTSLLLGSLGIAGLVIWFLQSSARKAETLRRLPGLLAAFALGFVLIPGILIAYFAAHGALKPLYYCVIEHNKLPQMNLLRRARYHVLLLALGGSGLLLLARFVIQRASGAVGEARAFVILAIGFYYLALEGVWPVVTFQDYMPVDPLFAACLAPLVLWLGDFLVAGIAWQSLRFIPPIAVLLVAVARIGVGLQKPDRIAAFALENPWKDATASTTRRIADVLALTRPGELVMDGKGESVFRPRTFYYVLELLTQKRMALGLIKDDIIERLIATRTAVLNEPRLPSEDQDFVESNYLSIGSISVLGKHLPPSVDGAIRFEVRIPETYSLVSGEEEIPGALDGSPLVGSRFLQQGWHEFRPANARNSQEIDLLLSRAHEKGYIPVLAQYTEHGNT